MTLDPDGTTSASSETVNAVPSSDADRTDRTRGIDKHELTAAGPVD